MPAIVILLDDLDDVEIKHHPTIMGKFDCFFRNKDGDYVSHITSLTPRQMAQMHAGSGEQLRVYGDLVLAHEAVVAGEDSPTPGVQACPRCGLACQVAVGCAKCEEG